MQNDFQIFRAWPYCGPNHFFKFSSLALLRCKYSWPYCRAPVYFYETNFGYSIFALNLSFKFFSHFWITCANKALAVGKNKNPLWSIILPVFWDGANSYSANFFGIFNNKQGISWARELFEAAPGSSISAQTNIKILTKDPPWIKTTNISLYNQNVT